MRRLVSLSAALFVSAGFASAAQAQNLIQNGSFETGDFTGWSVGGNTGFTSVEPSGTDGYLAEDGSYFAYLGPVGSDGVLTQSFADTVGGSLQISFWLAGNSTAPSDFGLSFDGTSLFYINPVPGQAYTEYTFDVTGTGSDTIQFNYRDDPNFIALDNISVVEASTSVPEPGSITMMSAVLGALTFGVRRRSAGKATRA